MTSATVLPGRRAGQARAGLSPNALLLVSGGLIGLNFPLGKLAADAGVTPIVWAGLISWGVVLVLLPVQIARRQFATPSAAELRYAMVSSVISFVVPNLLVFSVMPRAGVGYTGLMYALSPVFTLLFAALLGMRTPGALGRAGIAVGLCGAMLVSLTRSAGSDAPSLPWMFAAVGIPIALASGNVYRSRFWPRDAVPATLAFWGHACAAGVFLLLLIATRGGVPFEEIRSAGGIGLIQVLASGLTFPFLYQLQRDGGPVLLSQLGYVAAAVGLASATLFLGERYAATTWFGAAVIALGIGTTIIAQRREVLREAVSSRSLGAGEAP